MSEFMEDREKDIQQAVKLGQELLTKNKKMQMKIEERDSKLEQLNEIAKNFEEMENRTKRNIQENETLKDVSN